MSLSNNIIFRIHRLVIFASLSFLFINLPFRINTAVFAIDLDRQTMTTQETILATSLVTRKAPGFTATALMPDGSFKDISLSDYLGKSDVLLYMYPLDFTFVCPSEIIAFDKAYNEFKSRGVEVLGCSVDSHFTHSAYTNTPRDKGGIGKLQYPLLSDLSRDISKKYGILLDAGMSLRGLFLIDKKGIVRHSLVNDLPIGRSVEEAIRVVDAMQFVDKHGEVCPANWKKGDKAMKPTAEGVASYLAEKA